jgi:hypothetical protein
LSTHTLLVLQVLLVLLAAAHWLLVQQLPLTDGL